MLCASAAGTRMSPARPSPARMLLAFATIYVVWGSSYAATKFVVLELPPLLAAGARFTAAGLLLGLVAWLRGEALPVGGREWRHCLTMALFMIVASAGTNVVAMQHVTSSQSALLNASGAFWIALLGALGARGHALAPRTLLGLTLGFAGVAILIWPRGGFDLGNLSWQLSIVLACLSWAIGTVYYRHAQPTTAALMFIALQMLAGGLAMAAAGVAHGDLAHWHFTWRSHVGLAYVVVFSSCIAYSAFAYLIRHTTPARLGTYAYVNPAIAALVGWLLLGEQLSGLQLLGMAVILLGVVLVTLPKRLAGAAARPPAPAEPSG